MTKMQQSLVPVLLLATVAFSSSNVLPVLSINQLEADPVGIDSQQHDNTLISKYPRNILNDIFYTISIATPHNNQVLKYVNNDNNILEYKSSLLNKEDTYNGEGFRKEQWHNYPRQLDRLHEYLYDHHSVDKRNPDPDDPNDYTDESPPSPDNDINTNEYPTTNDDKSYETVVSANPLLIFKIRLACFKDQMANSNKYSDMPSQPEYIPDNKIEKELYKDAINPDASVTKVKREDEVTDFQRNHISENSMTKNRAVKKRIFSLWSRLQSFNHKGHELQHRRHLHAFYGLPDGDGGGVLTAETRATLMRPHGSPLRWG